MPTAQEIRNTQGTRLQEKAPWETYAAEMDEKLDPKLAAEVAEYAKHRYADSQISSENKERLAEERERSREVAKQYQWVKPEEYDDFEARIGVVMTHSEFIDKLRTAGMNCWYTQHVHSDKAVLHASHGDRRPNEVVCWVQQGQMPELSIMNFDDHGAPLAERRRGWRTCLLQVIMKGFLGEQKVDEVFGEPRKDEVFTRYNATLRALRDAGNQLGE